MGTKGKAIGGVVLAVAIVYLFVLPWVVPPPRVSASIPAEVSLRNDPEIVATVRAWHGNVNVDGMRFYVDYYASTAKGPEGLFFPVMLFEGDAEQRGRSPRRSIFMRPWRRSLTVKLPLRDFARQRLVGPGVLEGKLDVSLSYIRPGRRPRPLTGHLPRQVTESVPFRITVRE